MKKLLAGILIPCMLLCLVSCATSAGSAVSQSDKNKATVSSISTNDAKVGDYQAEAYFLVFKQIYQLDAGINGGKYLAVDLTKVKLADKSKLIELIEDFCERNGYTLLQDTEEGLKEKGYINDSNFENGFLISFEDYSLTEEGLVTSATKWRSGRASVRGTFEVQKKDDSWQITKSEELAAI